MYPDDRVEVIVLVEQNAEAEEKDDQSFLDAVAGSEIDTPTDYSTTFEDDLYVTRRE